MKTASITERIARYRCTRVMSHVVESMTTCAELWECEDLQAVAGENPKHIVGVRNDEAFCYRCPAYTCDAPISVQANRS